MDNNGHSECSSDSEGDNDDDIQLRDRDVELREELEFCNGRLRRKAVSSNFQDDVDDEGSDKDDSDNEDSGDEEFSGGSVSSYDSGEASDLAK
nr:unnamed protein product [Digitaria exilis]